MNDTRQQNVVLIGFMGSGKTSVGIRLSYRLRMPVEDTDKLIERREGRSVSEIFGQSGEAYFRRLETELLKELTESGAGARIYSVGGGTPVRPENRELLKKLGIVVYLRARPETVYERLRGDTSRPLLMCDDPPAKIRAMMESRKEAYEETADLIFDVDGRSPEQIQDEIVAALEQGGTVE